MLSQPSCKHYLSRRSTAKSHRFQNLYGSLNESLLFEAWHNLNKKGAPGVDKVTIAQYGEHLGDNIRQLVERLKGDEYRSRFHPSRKIRFTFLGFEFYWEPDTKGIPRVWRRTARKKLQAGIKACKDWLKSNCHKPLNELMPTMVRKVRGHYNYFRAIGNSSLWTFYKEIVGLLYKWLNRRSQRRSLTWDSLKRVLVYYTFPTPS